MEIYSLPKANSAGSFRIISLLLIFIVLTQYALAQRSTIHFKDSLDFSAYAQTFKEHVTKEDVDQQSKSFFQKASQLNNPLYPARAAAIISEVYFNQHDKTAGESWYNKAQTLFHSQNSDLEAGICNLNIGKLLTRNYDFETGQPYLLKSVDDFAKINNYNKQATALNILSLAYHDFGEYDKGTDYARQVIDLLSKHEAAVNKNLFWYGYNNLGINFDDGNQPLKAIEAHQRALIYAINASDSSYSYNNLGNTFKKLNNLTEAEQYFIRSLEKSTDYEDTYHMATIYSNMVDIERRRKNYAKAHLYLDSALHYAGQSGSPEKLLDIYYYSYQLKNETGNHQEAVNYLLNHLKLKDSFFTAEKNKAVLQYQAKYESEKKENALMQTQLGLAESELASKQKNSLLVIAALGLAIAIILLLNQKFKSGMKEKQLVLEKKLLQEQADLQIQQHRLQLSRNLHDSMGAQLTLLSATADGLKNTINTSDVESRKKLSMLTQLCETSFNELRNTLWVLNKTQIMLADLRLKLLNFINQTEEATEKIKFHVSFMIEENIQIAAESSINFFRLMQELINNAVKHAGATDIHITVLQQARSFSVHFSDNGKGFDSETAPFKSYGLANIRSRVAEMGGTIQLNSTGGGTTYLIKINL
jgi:signal transduction histidine kinase